MELRHLEEEKATALIGFSFYSNSESTVLSYASIFEVLYNQSVLFEQLKQEDSVKNEFINIAAHELRTPIMPILNGMEILEEKLGEHVDKYRHEIDIITRNASRLQNLAESILQVSRIESGTFSLSIQSRIDIHALIAKVIEDVEKKYTYTDKAGKVSIVFLPFFDCGNSEQEGIGTGSSSSYNNSSDNANTGGGGGGSIDTHTYRPLYVDCDSQKVGQVVFNLLDNAMKFTFEGKVIVHTTRAISDSSTTEIDEFPKNRPNENMTSESRPNHGTGMDYNNNSVLVTVRDTGVGIGDQIKNQLFEKFATKSPQGTGLGLYLSKRIVEAHGGHIWYEEPPLQDDKDISTFDTGNGKNITTGTVFKFVIPLSISKKSNSIPQRKIIK